MACERALQLSQQHLSQFTFVIYCCIPDFNYRPTVMPDIFFYFAQHLIILITLFVYIFFANKKYVSPLPELKLYKEVIFSVFKAKTRLQRNDVQQAHIQLNELNKRLSKARDLLLSGDIEADDYRIIKSESEEKINRLEAKLTASVTDTTNVEPVWERAISNLSQLDILYTEGTVT